MNSLEEYKVKLRKRRDDDGYIKQTDSELELHSKYIEDCFNSGLSVYKCLEFMYFQDNYNESNNSRG